MESPTETAFAFRRLAQGRASDPVRRVGPLLVKQSTQPFGNRISNEKSLSVTALSDSSEGSSEIVVVENQNYRKCLNCGLEVCDSARKSSDQFLRGHVMSTLGDAHSNAFLGSLGAGNSDEAEYNVVAGGDRVREERQLLARQQSAIRSDNQCPW